MRSDVSIGVNLSGGLDSTAIICASARVRDERGASEPLFAFSYNDPEFDEWRYLKDTEELTKATLVSLLTNPQHLWDDLARVLWFQDEPVHSMTAIVGYQLMALAGEHRVKVILNGQGADETLGGYSSYFRDYWFTLARRDGVRRAWGEIGAFTEVHGGRQTAVALRVLRHVGQTRLSGLPGYGALRRWRSRRRHQAHTWFTRELADRAVDAAPEASELDDVLASSVVQRPMPLYLRVEDRNSMAHGIECRLPFLDFRLVSLVFGLAKEWKLRGPWNKYVLRDAMRGRIPESVRLRPDKMGFPTAAPRWMTGSLYDPLLDVLSSRQARERGIYNTEAILRDLQRHRQGAHDVSAGLFSVAELELWFSIGQAASPPAAPEGKA
jgi:asparagine synthase (glutamine-hydrolysing)